MEAIIRMRSTEAPVSLIHKNIEEEAYYYSMGIVYSDNKYSDQKILYPVLYRLSKIMKKDGFTSGERDHVIYEVFKALNYKDYDQGDYDTKIATINRKMSNL